jgi:hypothetical protein
VLPKYKAKEKLLPLLTELKQQGFVPYSVTFKSNGEEIKWLRMPLFSAGDLPEKITDMQPELQ